MNDACGYIALIDVASYLAETEVPSPRVLAAASAQARLSATGLQSAAAAQEPDQQAVTIFRPPVPAPMWGCRRARSGRVLRGASVRQYLFDKHADLMPQVKSVKVLSRGYFFNRSRISVSNLTSRVGSGGGAGGSAVFNLLIPLTARNSTHAIMRKFSATLRN